MGKFDILLMKIKLKAKFDRIDNIRKARAKKKDARMHPGGDK